jgi:MurNAc alpha-1-phosphate uridylyltransferase
MIKAMILAAGRGERMRPLTDSTPKPLLPVCGKPLIQHHIEALRDAGVRDLVINHAWLGEKIEQALGDGAQFDVRIRYSAEGDALETGGGIFKALPLLGAEPFVVVNGDIMTDFSYRHLPAEPDGMAHLVMVPNPPHNESGDFSLKNRYILPDNGHKYTFSGIGLYRPEMFADCSAGKFPLAPILRRYMSDHQVTGEVHRGLWMDIGTPERLEYINAHFCK